ncbi:hypothetical protein CCACVL1_24947 [Corchorus capsularis]|uniref:Uncharacterized protein n=1 Tax=Corchorus capsularis TaxID=210143 RepID=A0A1R3GMJ4_COCAP|nr:hypothetical protein CCACVL1_24947 [Corchorus capsularis]
MDSNTNKESWNFTDERKKTVNVKEVKGHVVDEAPQEEEKEHLEQVKERNGSGKKTGKSEGVKGLPHQQVPQPGDFSTEVLEKL